ncbi:DUF2969 domain-containing protein [Lentilactobacillus senioris]|uniref:DUF2969 domain-containing protein n=1 Tax=Lentilactobacillus senioris DSM 24302 = JCM 17472 TaxID=1423802 RepID=A0A0R2D0C2_9LACO|nr:DUF2969 domain-containing protein [Lentilactobacillus senioris]KRM93638.1 hypothetical protein FC56_GL000355 [Lentilactobacillus senioris DSM 24302 = JCM 17472]
MSKAKKSIEVEITEKKAGNGKTVSEVYIGKQFLGNVREDDNKFLMTTAKNESFKVNSFDEGIQELIKEFHLHH